MSDWKRVSRTHIDPQERRLRSELTQIVSQREWIRGSLLVRRRRCGKSNCRCTRGQLHENLYVAISEKGRTRQLFIPKDWEAAVRRWVQDYRRARELMDEISHLHWEKVRERKR